VIESGIGWRWIDREAQDRDVEVRDALQRLVAAGQRGAAT